MDIIKTAYYILGEYENISPLKLQKLLYYLKAWGLVAGSNLITEPFVKWMYGPVNQSVYTEFKSFGENPIVSPSAGPLIPTNPSEKTLVDFILECYTPYDAITLSSMTHQDAPWKDTAMNSIISNHLMQSYYSSLPFAKNLPFDPQKPFHPVQTDLHYAYIFDMNPDVAQSTLVYSSYDDYKKHMQSAQTEIDNWLSTFAPKQ